MGISYQ
ncbi:hypothetical protein YPPY64_3473, partial [Yersinia pestis PY-64]